MGWEKYYRPSTAVEAVALLTENQGEARVLAGGSDLMLQLRENEMTTNSLVDLSSVKELQQITEEQGWIKIGAMVTHQQIASSKLVSEKARVLQQAAQSVGSPQIRNIATIGGNVVNAQPAADTTIALLVLDAKVRILTKEGEISKSIDQLFLGPGKSAVDPAREIVLGFEFRTTGNLETTVFKRHAKRKALALPIVNLGVWVKSDETVSKFEDIRIAMGPMAPVPLRITHAEALLKGAPFNVSMIKEAILTVESELKPRDSIRGSAFYKRELAKVLLIRALIEAVKDLGGEIDRE